MKKKKWIFHIICMGMVSYQIWGTLNPPIFGSKNLQLRNTVRSVFGVGGFFTFYSGRMLNLFLSRYWTEEATVVVNEEEKFKKKLNLSVGQFSSLRMSCLSEQGMAHFIKNYPLLLLDAYPEAKKIQLTIKSTNLLKYKKGDQVHERFHETFRVSQ